MSITFTVFVTVCTYACASYLCITVVGPAFCGHNSELHEIEQKMAEPDEAMLGYVLFYFI
jgi:hypothetical protein